MASQPLTWATPVQIDASDLWGVSCSSDDTCIAVDEAGNIVTLTAGVWDKVHVDSSGALDDISCPTTGLCVAIDNAGDVVTSTEPTGGATSWTVVHVDGTNALTSVSCPSATLCVATDDAGNIVTSTEPSNPTAGAWTVTPVRDPGIHDVSCPSTGLCVAIDNAGDVVTSTKPSNPTTKAWIVTRIDGTAAIDGVSCPSVNLCVAVDIDNRVLSSTNPTGGATAWTATYIEGPNGLRDVSCGTPNLCAATTYGGNGSDGNVIASSDPAGGADAWTETNVYGDPIEKPNPIFELYAIGLTGVSCPSASLCAVVDTQGRIIVGTPSPAAAPVNISPPMLSGTPTAGQTLSCSEGSWSGEPLPTLAYQWLRDDAPIAGATASTYTVQRTDQGDSIACRVTAANITGSTSAVSAALQVPPQPNQGDGDFGGDQGGRSRDASNVFAVTEIASLTRHGTIRIALNLPGPGTLLVVARADRAHLSDVMPTRKRHNMTLVVAQLRVTVSSARRIMVTLTPTAKARATLTKRRKLKATVVITYTPKDGQSRSTVIGVIFRLKQDSGPDVGFHRRGK